MLVAAAFWFGIKPAPAPLVSLSLSTPALTAGAPEPLALTVRSNAAEPLKNVRLRWRFPAGTQLLQSAPLLSADGSVFLGDLHPGSETVSHVIARSFLAIGETATFTVEVSYDLENGSRFTFFGSAMRPIEASALVADIPEAVRSARFVSFEGTTIPIQVTNRTSSTLPLVHLTYQINGTDGEERRTLGDLLPGENRFIFVPLKPSKGDFQISWNVGAASRDLMKGAWSAVGYQTDVPRIEGRLISRTAIPTRFTAVFDDTDGGLVIIHPSLSEQVMTFGLSSNQTIVKFVSAGRYEVALPALPENHPSNHEWLVIPVLRNNEGIVGVLGPASLGATAGELPFTSQVRYLSTAGDQLGAGPRPPQVGLETRYWAFWTIGPVESELKNIVVETDLPEGVRATGNISSPEGGSVVVTGRHVRFTLPRMGGDTDVAEVSAGFEIAITPDASNEGSILTLLETSVASAEDTHQTSLTFQAEDGPETTWLPEDKDNQARGIVVPKQ
jgi:hypothetical protein